MVTLAYALGAALPMLAIALAGQRVAAACARTRDGPPRLGRPHRRGRARDRPGADRELQTWLPGYTETLQNRRALEAAQRELRELTGSKAPEAQAEGGGND